MKIISFVLCYRVSWLPLIEMEVFRIAQSVKNLAKCLIWIIYSKIWGWWVQSPRVPRVLNLWSYFVVGQSLMRVEFEDNCSLQMYLSNTNVPSKVIWDEDYLSLEMKHKEYLNLKKVQALYFLINSWYWIKCTTALKFKWLFSLEKSRKWEKGWKRNEGINIFAKILRSGNSNKKNSVSCQGHIPVHSMCYARSLQSGVHQNQEICNIIH